MAKIHSIQTTLYSHGEAGHRTVEHAHPTWAVVEQELRTMERYAKPILTMLASPEHGESNLLVITGGDGVYHIQVCDSTGLWREAVNPERGDEDVEVWTSDQGFITKGKYTRGTEAVLRIARWYYDHAEPLPAVHWR